MSASRFSLSPDRDCRRRSCTLQESRRRRYPQTRAASHVYLDWVSDLAAARSLPLQGSSCIRLSSRTIWGRMADGETHVTVRKKSRSESRFSGGTRLNHGRIASASSHVRATVIRTCESKSLWTPRTAVMDIASSLVYGRRTEGSRVYRNGVHTRSTTARSDSLRTLQDRPQKSRGSTHLALIDRTMFWASSPGSQKPS